MKFVTLSLIKDGQGDFNGNANAPTADCIVQETGAISAAPLTDDHSHGQPICLCSGY